MNLDALSGALQEHKGPALAVAGAGVVALALVNKRKKAAGSGATGAAGAAPGTPVAFSAGGQAAGTTGAGGYDSTASDLYGAIQPQLEALGQQLAATQQSQAAPTPVPAPVPIASAMYAPDPNNRNWIVLPNGVNGQVQSDGSVFGATAGQFFGAGGTLAGRSPVNSNVGYYSTESNVSRAGNNAATVAAGSAATAAKG